MIKLFFSVLCSTLIPVFIYGQEPVVEDTTKQKIIYINEVIVTGNIKTDPIHTTVKNNYAKKIVQPKNVADLFNQINGFSSIKRGNYAIDPSFRAAQYEQLNVQYDGGIKAMHACPNRMDPITTHVLPEEIAKIEIIKGPFSVRYGATFGGIINMVTERPHAGDSGFSGKFSAGYESNGNTAIGLVQLKYTEPKYDISGNFGYRDFGNYEDGDGTVVPSSFNSFDYSIKAGYNFTEDQRFQAHWRQSYGSDILHAGLPMDTEYDRSSIIALDYAQGFNNSSLKNFTAKVYYSYVDHLMNNFSRPSFMMMEGESSVEATTFGGKTELKWSLSPQVYLYTGLDLQYTGRDGTRNRLVKLNMMGMPLPEPREFNDKIWQDSYVMDLGFFAEAKWMLNATTVFTAGVRNDIVSSDIKDPEDDFAAMYTLEKQHENLISGTVSVKKQLSDEFTLEAAYGRGVRPANMAERYINHFNVGQDPYEYVGNPELEAEVNNQFEIGFKGNKDLSGGWDKLTYEASFYYSKYENYIAAVIDPTLTRKYNPMREPVNPKVFTNLNEAYKTGFEISTQLNFMKNFHFRGQCAYVYTRNKDLMEALPLTAPFTTQLGLGMEKEQFWINLQYNVVASQDHLSSSFGETATDGYQTLDLRLGLKPLKNALIGVAALNIFDRAYNNHLNFSFTNQGDFGRTPIQDPGRNITAFIQYSF